MEWFPLGEPVQASFVAGTGFEAATTDPNSRSQFSYTRLRARPDLTEPSSLDEMQVGLRLIQLSRDDYLTGFWETGARLQLMYAPDQDLRFPERDIHDWTDQTSWLPEKSSGVIAGQTFISPYPMLNGIMVRTATHGGDVSAGHATVGPGGAEVLSQPSGDSVLTTLAPGTIVSITGSAEGRAALPLPDGTIGYVPLDSFATLPPPSNPVRQPLLFTLYTPDGTILRVVHIAPEDILDNAHLSIYFEPIPDSEGKQYAFTLAFPTSDPSARISVRATRVDTYAEGEYIGPDNLDGIDLVFRPLYFNAQTTPMFETPIDTLPRKDAWLTINDPPQISPGQVVSVRVIPGDGLDADRLQYGITIDQVPVGGWTAVSGEGHQLRGTLLIRTYYERNVGLWSIVSVPLEQLKGAIQSDTWFTVSFISVIGGLAVAALQLSASTLARR